MRNARSALDAPQGGEKKQGNSMSDNMNATVDERVAKIVARLLPERARATPIANDEPLTTAGLNSLGMVNLLLEIEANFNITVPTKLVAPKTFRSIHSIARLIESIAPAE
jgi:acyl carrier protein